MRFATVLLCACLLSTFVHAQRDSYKAAWSRVYAFEIKDLPKSAQGIVDSIYIRAKRENNFVQLTRALLYQSKFALTLQPDAEVYVIEKFKKEIETSKPPLKNLLESMLAGIYMNYWKNNHWTYERRSTVSDPGTDFKIWDAATMRATIDRHFRNSLQNQSATQAVDLTSIAELLAQSNAREYRPTLYDLLAHRALEFYTSDTGGPTTFYASLKDERLFYPFGTVAVDTAASNKPAMKIYQSLYEFHAARKDTIALVDVEINRLEWLKNTSGLANRNELHKQALTRLKKRYQKHTTSTWIDFELAMIYYDEGEEFTRLRKQEQQFKFVSAVQHCDSAIARLPKSQGAQKCEELKRKIFDPSLKVMAEKYVPVMLPSRLLVRYQNLEKIRCAVSPVTEGIEHSFSYALDSIQQEYIKVLSIDTVWDVTLRTVNDYQEHETEIALPALRPGRYMFLISVPGQPTYAYTFVQVTDIALLESYHANKKRYQFVNRNNGAPLQNANVLVQATKYGQRDTIRYELRSDAAGFIWVTDKRMDYSYVSMTASHHQDSAVFEDYISYYSEHDPDIDRVRIKAALFTDRSIYRPGQTLYFKGILLKKRNNRSEVFANDYVIVNLEDPNENEVGNVRLKANAFGSFSGEFVIPASGLTGSYTLSVDEDFDLDSDAYDIDFDYESIEISVEEYKRPAFEVTFEPLTNHYALQDTIRVVGKATSFSGANLTGAKVIYRVNTTVNHDYSIYRKRPSSDIDPILGEAVVDNKGEFIISFYANILEEIPCKAKPVFRYEITADVTDITGETRSGEATVRAGYHSFQVKLTGPAKIVKNTSTSFTVNVTNLNEQPAQTGGIARIYYVPVIDLPVRERPWSAPDFPIISREEFSKLFPHDTYSRDDLAPVKKLITEIPVQKGQSNVQILAGSHWETGRYQMEVEANDPSGMNAFSIHEFDVLEKEQMEENKKLLWIKTDKLTYQVGDRVKVLIGSSAPNITVTVDIENNHKIIKSYTQALSGKPAELIIPANQLMTKGFKIHCSGAVYNSFLSDKADVVVRTPREKLVIETLTFRDKIKPGSEQRWSFRILGANAQKAEAELLASMYDASLDQFRKHSWHFDPMPDEYYYSPYRITSNSFGEKNFKIMNQTYTSFSRERVYYEQLDWFGFSITNDRYVKSKYLDRLYPFIPVTQLQSKVTMTNAKNKTPGYVYGRIISIEDDTALPGVSVVVSGTNRGTQTDGDGMYALEAKSGETLVYSFIGLATVEATVLNNKNTINVVMRPDEITLNEVVVTAGGLTVQRRELGNQATTVKSTEKFDSLTMTSLSGKLPGLSVTAISSGVEPAYRVVLRGQRSLLGNNQALLVLDGVITPSGVLGNLSANDILNIEVLNGTAATALYGSDGANGALIVSTISGQKKIEVEMAKITARKIFNETAFFFPHLTTDRNGVVTCNFTTPESLTRWKLMLLAHTKSLGYAEKTLTLVTQKEFMTTVHAPRFLRAGDEIVLSAKINNLTQTVRRGNAALVLTDALTGKPINDAFGMKSSTMSFQTTGGSATELTWRLKVPQDVQAVQYKVVARSGEFSDGEQNILPVLSDQILVTETLPMYVNGGQTKTFVLDKLKNSTSSTLRHHKLTLEFNANPVWYAVQSLPYLMEFPHECAEQTFSRYYANLLGAHIVNSNPKIKDFFSRWSNTDALVSALEKNPDLKSIVLQETPWLRDAQDETEQKKRIALLFDLKGMNQQLAGSLSKLESMQLSDGGFPWFSGGKYASRYITQHIVSGFGHLQMLNVEDSATDNSFLVDKALSFLDTEILNDYRILISGSDRIRAEVKDRVEAEKKSREYLTRKHINDLQVQYLYAISFFSNNKSEKELEPAVEYFRKQAYTYWKDFPLYLRGMIAIIAQRNNETELAKTILRSLQENSITNEALGMYWKENTGGYYWQQADIETQALLIETFSVLPPLTTETEKLATIDALKTWLLRNKQVNRWKSTKATTEAIYALLLTGSNWIESSNTLNITWGGEKINPSDAEAGAGLISVSLNNESIIPKYATVSVSKSDPGVAWGALYWQYFENLNSITSSETSIKLSRKIYRVLQNQNDKLTEINENTPVERGDLLRVRIELRSDRDLEFLHLKDMRAAGLEPVDVLSEYKWQNEAYYYQSTRDAATHFFFEELKTGVYVFEYDVRASASGSFSNGIATIQSMYAPEFSSHSSGSRISIK